MLELQKAPDKTQIANTQYILDLQYDLDKLLAVDLTPRQIDVTEVDDAREYAPGEVIIVTKKVRDASADLMENSLLNPGSGVIFPGALLKQDHTLAEGVPVPYTLPRGPLTIFVDLPGLEDKGVETVESPTNINVGLAIQKITDYWFDAIKDKQGYQPAMRAFAESHMAYTKEQIGIACGFGAQWGKSHATAGLKVDSTGEETIVYRVFKQIYYTVFIEEPEMAGAMFAEGVKLDGSNMPASAPPGFVRSVDYGRIIIVQMATAQQVTRQEAEATLEYKSLGTQYNADLKEQYENIAQNSTFKALVLGGGGGSAEVLAGDIGKMKDAITQGIEFTKKSPAYPISYIVADLKTRAISEMRTTTKYIETVRQVLKDRTIRLRHKGGFVANFSLKWEEFDESRKVYVWRTWKSGNKTAGYETAITFPGDARNFTVEGRYAIFFKTWSSKRLTYPVLDGDKTITIKGTTLNCKMTD